MQKRESTADRPVEDEGAAIDQIQVLNAAENPVDIERLQSEMKKIRPASNACGLCKIIIGAG